MVPSLASIRFGSLTSGAAEPRPLASCPVGPWVVVSDPAEAERLRPAWASLLERSARPELTQSPDWLLTWWQVYGQRQGGQLRLGLFHAGDRLVGLAPFLRRRYWYGRGLPFRRLEFLGSGEAPAHGIYSNHLAVLTERGAEEGVAARLVQAVVEGAFGSWDEVVLPMMAGDLPLPGLLVSAFRAAGLNAELTETARAPYAPLPGSWDAYLRGLSAHKRKNIRRSLKVFEAWAGGTTRLECVHGLADLDRGKEILVRLHHERWHSAGQPGVFRSPLYLQFHDALMPRLAESGALELLWLCARNEPVAVLYGMVWSGKVYAYQIGRRTDLPAHLRPGMVLLALAIRRAIEAGRGEFDLLADDVFYKRELAPQSRPLVRVRAVRPSLREEIRRGARSLAGQGILCRFRSGRG
ncbi:MAG: GNAT family N-acetyltransferase, partial [Planctomycetes bacterium]|nr:GNAT family N-acetyltransferase [Planctomycetota bacterium]